jgi:hypothetical protein
MINARIHLNIHVSRLLKLLKDIVRKTDRRVVREGGSMEFLEKTGTVGAMYIYQITPTVFVSPAILAATNQAARTLSSIGKDISRDHSFHDP